MRGRPPIPVGKVKEDPTPLSTNFLRRQSNGKWEIMDSAKDEFAGMSEAESLRAAGEPARMENMSEKKTVTVDTSLIPNADVYYDNGMNVLLIGKHGTGKTVSIQALAERRNLRMKYFSCSTLDPYTDLVGVPTPRDWCPQCKVYHKDAPRCPECQSPTRESLRNVRPHELDDADIIFFDELNRAESKTLNAVFEIIQFGSINGEPLVNLKACWGAINPPDDEQGYDVERLDPALVDRFDIYIKIEPKPSVHYMHTRGMPKHIANALVTWWNEHEQLIRDQKRDAVADYLSPRRLEKIGLVWCVTKSQASVMRTFPEGGNFAKMKLVTELKAAQKKVDQGDNLDLEDPEVDPELENDFDALDLGSRPYDVFTYEKSSILLDIDSISEFCEKHPNAFPTHKAITEALTSGVGGEKLISSYAKVLNSLNKSVLEGWITGLPQPKQDLMKKGFGTLYKSNKSEAKQYDTLHGVLKNTTGQVSEFPEKL